MAVDAILHVQPCIGAAWVAVTHNVDSVHMTGFVVKIVRFCVAEVKAALVVEIKNLSVNNNSLSPADKSSGEL